MEQIFSLSSGNTIWRSTTGGEPKPSMCKCSQSPLSDEDVALDSPASPENVSFKSVLNVRDAKGENRQETLQRRVIGAKFMKKKALPIHTRIGKNERKKGT